MEDERSPAETAPRSRLFSKLRIAALEKKIGNLEAELAALDKQTGDPAALAGMNEKRAALRARIRTLSDEWTRLKGLEES